MLYDKSKPEFWQDIRKGAFFDLSDEETLQESMEDGQGANSVTYELIENPNRIIIEDVCEFLVFNLLAKDKTNLLLFATIVDGEVELKVFFEDINILQSDDRAKHIENGDFWLFEEPEDIDNHWEPGDLEFAKVIEFYDSTYKMKRMGTMHGSFNNKDGVMASIAEYDLIAQSEDNETTNSEFMLYEFGTVDNENGGYLSALFGYRINFSEVDVLQ